MTSTIEASSITSRPQSSGLSASRRNPPLLGSTSSRRWIVLASSPVSERLSLWGVLGYGTGEVMLAMDANGERWTADTTLRMAAAGARSVLAT